MKYTLHKLPEGFIITSDEPFTENDSYYDTKQEKIRFGSNNHVTGGYKKKVIAQQDKIDFSSLSEEDQKKIGWFDVEKLFKKDTGTVSWGNTNQYDAFNKYLLGFQKSQELLSDRMFTKEDLETAIIMAKRAITPDGFINMDDIINYGYEDSKPAYSMGEIIQSMSQKSWKVELEMEAIKGNYIGRKQIGVTPAGEPIKINEGYEEILNPKFTNNKVKILKIS